VNVVEKMIKGSALRDNTAISCGCLGILDIYDIEQSSAKKIFNDCYSDGDLTFSDFYLYSQQSCFYCDRDNQKSNHFNAFISQSESNFDFAPINGWFNYNGLDRIDSSLPHNKNNVVPCCYQCNWSKSNATSDEFEQITLKRAILICQRNAKQLQRFLDAMNIVEI
jgi:hypothetical protein